jgi:hypothetical protein
MLWQTHYRTLVFCNPVFGSASNALSAEKPSYRSRIKTIKAPHLFQAIARKPLFRYSCDA